MYAVSISQVQVINVGILMENPHYDNKLINKGDVFSLHLSVNSIVYLS